MAHLYVVQHIAMYAVLHVTHLYVAPESTHRAICCSACDTLVSVAVGAFEVSAPLFSASSKLFCIPAVSTFLHGNATF